jgi:hypothetical protein
MASGGVREALDYPLSDSDIRLMLGDDISILTYPDLEDHATIDSIFDRKGRCVLLIPRASPTDGHWVCLLKKGREIEFFDPYGEAPENQKDGLSRSKLEELDMDRPILMKKLRASGHRVYYNTYGFQQEKPNINTCGRHAVVRCLYAPYTIDQYKKIIDKSRLTPDEFVVGITADVLKK